MALVSTHPATKTVLEADAAVTSYQNGLQLIAISDIAPFNSVNWTIMVSVQIYNTRPFQNKVPAPDIWPLKSLSPGPCSNWPAGIALYTGFLSTATASAGQALQRFLPSIYSCQVTHSIRAYIFQPRSSVAATSPSYSPGVPMYMYFSIYHIWVQGLNGQAMNSLQTGRYTLVAGDEWGQVLLFNLTIK